VQSYLFDIDKGWTLDKAKTWFEQHKDKENVKLKEHVSAILPFEVLEKIVDKPLRIRGVAMTAGMSRNFNIYTSEELQAFANKLVSAPIYIEHIAVPNAVGKVTKTEWDGQNLWYEAEVYDDEIAEKIRKGLIQHVSVGANYETIDVLDGKAPHGLHNAELSLVAVPGIPETNVQILEKLQAREQQAFEPVEKPKMEDAIAQINNSIDALTSRVEKLEHAQTQKPQSEDQGIAESLLKKPTEPMIPIREVIEEIEKRMPSIVVERSGGLGFQRHCQEMRGYLFQLRERMKNA